MKESTLIKRRDGTRAWYRHGELHRDGDKPAVEQTNGTRWWYRDGKLHREGGKPAVERANGSRWWYRHGELHRDGDKPAVEQTNGTRWWYRDGKRHREGDKPAVVFANGAREWWVNGKLIREEFAGWTAIYQDEARGYTLHRSPDGKYRAGCRLFQDAETAVAHWGAPDYSDPERGKQYVAAINAGRLTT